MITPDPTSPRLATGPHAEIEALLASLGDGASPQPPPLPDRFVQDLTEILESARGQLELVLSEPQGFSTHSFTLARAGVLRRSRGLTDLEDVSVHPTPTLPGVLLRLVGIAPVDPLDAATTLDLPEGSLAALFGTGEAGRAAAWTSVLAAAATLPAAARSELEQAPPRAARLTRRRESGDRWAAILLLRGRYLVTAAQSPEGPRGAGPAPASSSEVPAATGSSADPTAPGSSTDPAAKGSGAGPTRTLHGASPTLATRTLLRPLIAPTDR